MNVDFYFVDSIWCILWRSNRSWWWVFFVGIACGVLQRIAAGQPIMDQPDEMMDIIEPDDDDDEEEDEEDDELEEEYVMSLETEPASLAPKAFEDEEYHYEVLTADQIVQHMVDCIKEVNTVVQVFYLAFAVHAYHKIASIITSEIMSH